MENEGLTSQIAEARADIKLLEEEKIQFQKNKETAENRAEKAETELKKLEDRSKIDMKRYSPENIMAKWDNLFKKMI